MNRGGKLKKRKFSSSSNGIMQCITYIKNVRENCMYKFIVIFDDVVLYLDNDERHKLLDNFTSFH